MWTIVEFLWVIPLFYCAVCIVTSGDVIHLHKKFQRAAVNKNAIHGITSLALTAILKGI